MFFLNLGYRWNLAADVENLRGGVFLPSGTDAIGMHRRSLPEFRRVLFDPQLYLAGLNGDESRKVCARLASYPWFLVPDAPRFEGGAMTRTEWIEAMREHVAREWPSEAPEEPGDIERACTSAIDFQVELGCSHIILPSPLIVERENEAEALATWLDAGLEAAEDLDVGQPLLATIAIEESTLNVDAFAPAGFLDTVVDQTTSRGDISGVYIVIAQSVPNHPYDTPLRVQRAYLHLARAFGSQDYATIMTNFADVFGVFCGAFGATDCATGPSHSLRRLSLPSYRDSGGGLALPHFYSNRTISELLSETDLDVIVERRLLSRVRDVTEYSQDLMDELAAGGSAANLQSWAESRNNIGMAQRHFISRLSSYERALRRAPTNHRVNRVLDRLQTAAANMLLINRRLGADTDIQGKIAPAEDWLDLFEQGLSSETS